MRRLITIAALLVPVVAKADPGAIDKYTIDVHFQPPSYLGCTEGAVADAALNCDVLNPVAIDVGEFTPNFAWLIAGSIPEGTGPGAEGGIGGLQFGLEYPETVFLGGGFTLCTGGSEIPQDDLDGTWPESGTGNAVTWAGGCYLVTDNPDGVTKIGFIPINPGSTGFLFVRGDPRIGEAQAAGCDAITFRICRQLLGCGQTEPGGPPGEIRCGGFCAIPIVESSWGQIKSAYR